MAKLWITPEARAEDGHGNVAHSRGREITPHMAAFKKPFGFQPLEEQIRQRQAEHPGPVERGKHFDHPTAKYIFITLMVAVVLGHVAALIALSVMGGR